MKKTFNIGEYCMGGILAVSINKSIRIDCKDWDTKEILRSKTFEIKKYDVSNGSNIIFQIEDWLNDFTSSYYATKVLDYIEEKIPSIYNN